MAPQNSATNSEPKFGHILKNDIKDFLRDLARGTLLRTLVRDFNDLKDFYLDDDTKKRLNTLGPFRRWLHMLSWLLKSLFLKLTPLRRVLLLTSIVIILFFNRTNITVSDVSVQVNLNIFATLTILFILMLELMDKLLAQSELEAGRSVQRALMPPKTPVVPGWSLWLFTRPANQVGGDLLDFQAVDNDLFGVALGDVSGKGLAAALFMAKLQATLRALAPDFLSLAELGSKLNQIFHRDSTPQNFASLLYLILRANSDQVRIVNAGHMPPIMVLADKIEEIPKGAPALGISPDSLYQEQRVEIQAGDYLLAYSDGLTEARNRSGDFYGEQRLLRLLSDLRGLSAENFGERLLTEVDRFTAEAKASDDLSLAVLKRIG